jgi:hypothetical protein
MTIGNQRNGESEKPGSGSDYPGFALSRGEKSESRLAGEPGFKAPRNGKHTPAPVRVKKHPVVRGFGLPKQREFLKLLMQGASPQLACKKLKLEMASFWHTLEHDARFAAELQKVWDALSYNVVAALYQAAIKGNHAAQQFWLKHRPPPHWSLLPGGTIADDLENLSHDELLDRARQETPDFAAEIEARIAKAGGGLAPETVSRNDLRPNE